MIVFNLTTILQLILAAIPWLIAMGISYFVGGNSEKVAWIIGAVALIIIDGLWRLSAMAGGDEGDEGDEGEVVESTSELASGFTITNANQGDDDDDDDGVSGPLALILPSGGGHVMFLPNWLVGGIAIYMIASGFWT